MISPIQAEFKKSCASKKDFLADRKQVVFLGRSNVGKSSLINSICNNKKLVYVSSTPGRTKLISYFEFKNGYLVDAPGYGYYKDGSLQFEQMMLDYFSLSSKIIKRIYLLLDSRREISQLDIDTIKLLETYDLNVNFVITKVDKLNMSEKDRMLNRLKETFGDTKIYITSSKTRKGIDDVIIDINNAVKEK